MSDMISRESALAIVGPMQWSNSPVAAVAAYDAYRAISAIPAAQPAPVTVEDVRDAILKGMHIALTTPIEEVPEAIESALRALAGDKP